MASFNGIKTPNLIYLGEDYINYNISNLPSSVQGDDIFDSSIKEKGTQNDNQPISSVGDNHNGIKAIGFFDDYYNRIHINPARFDLGNILVTINKEYYVWNAFVDTSQTCNTIDSVNSSEVQITGETAPFTLLPLEETKYDAVISDEGSANFTTTYTYFFNAIPQNVTVVFTGQRLITFAFPPETPVIETLEYKTNIMTSYDGSEHRERVRQEPVQKYSYNHIISDKRANILYKNNLIGWQGRNFGVPIWTEMSLPNTTIAAGSSSISLDTTEAYYTNTAIIYKNWDNFEIINIENVIDTGFDVPDLVQNTWDPPYKIMPLKVGHLLNSVDTEISNQDILTKIKNEWVIDEKIDFGTYTPTSEYNSKPVFQDFFKFRKNMPKQYDINNLYNINSGGVYEFLETWTFPKISKKILLFTNTRDDIKNYKSFFNTQGGSQKTFFTPLWEKDIILSRDVGSADVSFFVDNLGYERYLENKDLRKYVVLIDNGTWYYREIISITNVSDTEEAFEIDSSFGVNIDKTNYIMYFLVLHRMNDRIDIKWQNSNGQSEIGLNITELGQ